MSVKMQVVPIFDIKVPDTAGFYPLSIIDEMAASLKKLGNINPIIVDEELMIVDGALRYWGAKKLGMQYLLATIVDKESAKDLQEIISHGSKIPHDAPCSGK